MRAIPVGGNATLSVLLGITASAYPHFSCVRKQPLTRLLEHGDFTRLDLQKVESDSSGPNCAKNAQSHSE